MKVAFKILAFFAVFSVLVLGIKACNSTIKPFKRGVSLPGEIAEKTMTADEAIQNYEWFKQQEADIIAWNKKEITAQSALDNYKTMLSVSRAEWTRFDKEELSKLMTNITGLSNMVDEMIAEYNAKSNMTHRSIFKDNLPTNIIRGIDVSLEFITGGE